MNGMRIRRSALWYVPAFCVAAGIVAYQANVHILIRFVMVRLPDGSVSSDEAKTLILYGAVFLAVLFLGGLVFFRGMTRREIFFSTSILVLYGVVLTVVQQVFHFTTGPAALWFMYLFRPFEWCVILPMLLLRLGINQWLGFVLQMLSLYLFVPFGKRSKAGT